MLPMSSLCPGLATGSASSNVHLVFMDKKKFRVWCVLDWNVRGLNSDQRQRDVRAKVDESNCSVVCIQETKMDFFYHRILMKFLPKRFDNFAYSPAVGASGGILVAWCSSLFHGTLIEIHKFGIIIKFTSTNNAESWNLVTVYGPCLREARELFTSWLYHLPILPDTL